jgi:hypothetical protein
VGLDRLVFLGRLAWVKWPSHSDHAEQSLDPLVIDFDRMTDIRSVDGGDQVQGRLRLRNSGPKSLTDVTLRIAALDVISVLPGENPHMLDTHAIAQGLIDAPLMMARDNEQPRLKSLPLLHGGDTMEFYVFNVARNGFLNIVHSVSQAVHVPSQGTQYIGALASSFPPGRYRVRLKAQARDVMAKEFTYIVDFNRRAVTMEFNGGAITYAATIPD